MNPPETCRTVCVHMSSLQEVVTERQDACEVHETKYCYSHEGLCVRHTSERVVHVLVPRSCKFSLRSAITPHGRTDCRRSGAEVVKHFLEAIK